MYRTQERIIWFFLSPFYKKSSSVIAKYYKVIVVLTYLL
jgi:hypothetical protein